MFIENYDIRRYSTLARVAQFWRNNIPINMPTLWVRKADIDEMIYELYDLTEEDIKIVENS